MKINEERKSRHRINSRLRCRLDAVPLVRSLRRLMITVIRAITRNVWPNNEYRIGIIYIWYLQHYQDSIRSISNYCFNGQCCRLRPKYQFCFSSYVDVLTIVDEQQLFTVSAWSNSKALHEFSIVGSSTLRYSSLPLSGNESIPVKEHQPLSVNPMPQLLRLLPLSLLSQGLYKKCSIEGSMKLTGNLSFFSRPRVSQ